MSRVMVVSADRVGQAMAGPAIRAWEMARLLGAAGNDVHLVVPAQGDRPPEGFAIAVASPREVALQAEWADVIIVQGLVLATYPALKLAGKKLVVDLYDPINLEILELFHDHPWEERLGQYRGHLGAVLDQVVNGDFFLCASEKQRDYWLGMLSGADRVNPHTHGNDRLLRRLIDIAPFGMPADPPVHSGVAAARGVLPGIEKDCRLAIWGGGVYNWFDPLSLLRAWPAVLERVPNARLLFMGMSHPNPDVPAMAMASRALELSEELGLRDVAVHFNLGWVPYDRRRDFLLEADIGVSTHYEHIETGFSFRTRIVDYIWAGLPVVSTQGDEFDRWITSHQAGRVVRYEDPGSIADAVVALLGDEAERASCAERVKAARGEFNWERSLAPLVRYCADPWTAEDRVAREVDTAAADRAMGSMLAPAGLVPKLQFFLRREGPLGLARRVIGAVRRRLARSLSGDPR